MARFIKLFLISAIASILLVAQAPLVVNPSQVTVDAASEAALIKWSGTQHGARGSELVSPINANETKLNVKNPVNFSTGVAVVIDSEQMDVKAVNGGEITVTRGFNGTTKAVHAVGAPVNILKYRTVNDFARALIIENFRKIVEDQDIEAAAASTVVAAKSKSSNGVK